MDDRTAARQLLWLSAPLAVVVGAAWALGGRQAALGSVAAALVALGAFAFLIRRRKRELRHLAAEVDEVLRSGRVMRFSDYREGDLAILRNELEKMVERLGRLTDQLSRERGVLADALADISHQIRTPLTAAELMLPAIERTEDADERKRLLRELEGLLDRVSWLVATLLKIAKADAGALTMGCERVSVASVAKRACAPLAVAFDLRDVTLDLRIPDQAGFSGDGLWSAEALENIVKNCLEHTPAGGVIVIEAAEDALATRIAVQDSGPGIAPADLPHLFERFYRGAEEPPTGFGVGLALAQALIAAQGGTVRASNVIDGDGAVRGARFEIAFPKLCV